MTDKELRRMSRARLIDLLIEQTERNDQLQARLDSLEKQVKHNTITISSAGSIADAAQELNRVLTSADKGSEVPEPVKVEDQRYEELIAEAKRRAVENRELEEAMQETRVEYVAPERERPVRVRDPEPPARVKKPAQKSSAARRSESAPKKTKPRAPDPFDEVPLDDYMSKAFSQMRKRNSR